jgi:cobalt-zinc-cadmium efflux system protein
LDVSRDQRLAASLLLNVGIVAAEAVFGLLGHSLGLLADAGHNVTDVAALALALVAVRMVRRPPTRQRSYGYHRATILAAQTNALLIFGVTVLIMYEAARRFGHPQAIHGAGVIVVASVALIINAATAWVLYDKSNDLNMRSSLLHMVGDAATSLGVLLAAAVVLSTGRFYWLDPAVSVLIGLAILWQAWRLLRGALEVLLESTPADLETKDLQAAMLAVQGVEAVHDLHVWSLSSEVRALSAHVVLAGHPSLEEAQALGTKVKVALALPFQISHATLELECENCVDDGSWCAIQTSGGQSFKI